MLTTKSDASLAWMHHRMPILLNSQEEVDDWLDSKTVSYDDALKNLPLKHSDWNKEYKLQYHIVDKKYVNNTSCIDKQCMERLSVKRKITTLDSWLKQTKK